MTHSSDGVLLVVDGDLFKLSRRGPDQNEELAAVCESVCVRHLTF